MTKMARSDVCVGFLKEFSDAYYNIGIHKESSNVAGPLCYERACFIFVGSLTIAEEDPFNRTARCGAILVCRICQL